MFLSSADFFQNQRFRKILSGIPSECQTVWIQIRPDKMTVCKCYQQTTLVVRELITRNAFAVLESVLTDQAVADCFLSACCYGDAILSSNNLVDMAYE